MQVSQRNEHRALDRYLHTLAPPQIVARWGVARLVVARTGGFVLVPAQGEVVAAARLAVDLAERTRAAIVERVPLAPFLDPMVVTYGGYDAWSPAAVLPVDLLNAVIGRSPLRVAPEVVERVARTLRAEPVGGWVVGWPEDGATIDLCDPATTAS